MNLHWILIVLFCSLTVVMFLVSYCAFVLLYAALFVSHEKEILIASACHCTVWTASCLCVKAVRESPTTSATLKSDWFTLVVLCSQTLRMTNCKRPVEGLSRTGRRLFLFLNKSMKTRPERSPRHFLVELNVRTKMSESDSPEVTGTNAQAL